MVYQRQTTICGIDCETGEAVYNGDPSGFRVSDDEDEGLEGLEDIRYYTREEEEHYCDNEEFVDEGIKADSRYYTREEEEHYCDNEAQVFYEEHEGEYDDQYYKDHNDDIDYQVKKMLQELEIAYENREGDSFWHEAEYKRIKDGIFQYGWCNTVHDSGSK